MKIGRRYTFQAAHRLPRVPEHHKCGRLHGHTYALDVELDGPTDPALGWVLDYAMLDEIVRVVIVARLDHRYLNEIEGLENPTSEVLVDWIWDRLSVSVITAGVTLARVRVSENEYSWAERRPYER